MKGIGSFLILFFYMLGQINSQSDVTLVLQPDAESGKDANIESRLHDENFGDHIDFPAIAWTNGGEPVTVRGLIEFDLSSIPASATIISAELSLFSYNSPFHGSHSELSGSNESVLQRVTSPWEEFSVIWDNQPEATSENQVFLASSGSGTNTDYMNMDVLPLVLDMINEPSESFGFLYKLVNESYYRQMIFASSDHDNPALHPKLVISYSMEVEETCLDLRPDAVNGKDALIESRLSNENFGDHPDFVALAWTNGGTPVDARGLIEFDLSSIPSGTIINSSILSLYAYTSPYHGAHSTLSGSNESFLSRITSEWEEDIVTWNNQPIYTSDNQVFLDASSSEPAPDYLEIDVTALIQDMLDSPSGNHGFLYQLVNEAHYRQMIFASSDNPDASLHPRLQVCYGNLVSSRDDMGMNKLNFQVYPNPAREFIKLDFSDKHGSQTDFQLISPQGSMLLQLENIKPGEEIWISNLSKGMYYISIFQNGEKVTRKLLLQ